MRHARLSLLWVAVLLIGRAGAAEISPATAYAMAHDRGRVADVEIAGDLDISRFKPPARRAAVELVNVTVRGRVLLRDRGPPIVIRFQDCELAAIDFGGARLQQAFELDRCRIRDYANFEDTTFGGAAKFTGVDFNGKAIFRRATFEKNAEFVNARFIETPGLRGGTSFAEAVFKGNVRFDEAKFSTNVRFDSAVFEGDATFLKLEVADTASFRNVQFRRDAEFRFCRLGRADFGDYEQMSAFQGLADFRGCRIDAARFDYAEFRGIATFTNAAIGPGGLSLQNANFRGDSTDLAGLQVAGKLELAQSHFSSLRFRWSEIGAPTLRAAPDASVLGFLHKRLEELGEDEEAREVFYHLATQRTRDRLESPQTEWPEKAWRVAEWLVWGLPTGYGTKLGRIALIAAACWLLLALPMAWRRGLLVSLPDAAREKTAEPGASRYGILPLATLDAGAYCEATVLGRVAAAYRYTFGLMFKTPPGRFRPVDPPGHRYAWYLQLVWWLGSLLLALLALTLANTSPIIQSILGKIAL